MSSSIDVYCDFDGTITRGDTIDVLLEELADPAWHAIEERWVRGEIGSRECMALQVPLIRGGWDGVVKVLDKVKIDPTFPKFANWCRQNGVALRIVSDGIDRVIHHILKRENIHVDNVWANHLVEDEDKNLQLTFPHAPQVLGCGSGLCKCRILENGSSRPLKVVIGDGRSDFCWSAEADLVFAKTKLLSHCKQNNIACVAYEDFYLIRNVLEEKLAEAGAAVPNLKPVISYS
ncbi:MAG: MtnX-like HAD-IB family phosphatase [Candidatus Obscuribacterales bacterium]|nr:MtnX-like HAD-IB family phosphatase [Cyanobacteria bacterium SZAS LIN-5]